jgi:coenzyme F420 hydrogenase subunit beta
MRRPGSLEDVVRHRLCLGCGACAYLLPGKVVLYDFEEEGIRPVTVGGSGDVGAGALDVCPVVGTDFRCHRRIDPDSFERKWGPVLEVWEGYAADPVIRFRGSSGGVLTALAAYCLERQGAGGVLHIGEDAGNPVRNRTYLSRTREELLERAGSRYAPAAVCDHLEWVEHAPDPCVVIGRPVEIAALRKAQRMRPRLSAKVLVALSFFCAESPSTKGTVALLDKLGVATKDLRRLRYRGHGWPGHFTPLRHGEQETDLCMSYRDSWAFLQAFRPWSAHLWPDGTGELADISCGDAWYQQPDGVSPGCSLVLVRTERGRELVRGAIEAGYLVLKPAERWKLEVSQRELLRKKGAVWGRILALHLCGLPAPRFRGGLLHCWLQLPFHEKVRSILGTLRRIVSRRLWRPLPLERERPGRSPDGGTLVIAGGLGHERPVRSPTGKQTP